MTARDDGSPDDRRTGETERSFPVTPAEYAAQLHRAAEAVQRAGEELTGSQLEIARQLLAAGGTGGAGAEPGAARRRDDRAGDGSAPGDLGAAGLGSAVFKTHVQSGGRISIPDAEREALGIEDGDLVQAVVVPLRADAGRGRTGNDGSERDAT